MSNEQRLKIKRAILSELNSQLAKKAQNLQNDPTARDRLSARSASSSRSNQFNLPEVRVKKMKSKSIRKPSSLQKENTSTPKAKKSVRSIPSKTSSCAVVDGLKKKLQQQDLEKVRKFADHWKKLTFGSTSHLTAVSLYRKNVLLKGWRKWCEHVWKEKNEWRLIVRADCHRRFMLREKYWEKWRLFIATNKVKQHKIKLADDFASKFVLKGYFQRLKSSISQRKDRDADKFLADTIYNKNLLKVVMSQWKNSLTEQMEFRQKEGHALYFWALSLERRMFLSWVRYNNNQKVKHDIKSIATNIGNQKLMKQMMLKWVMYRRHRKVKALRTKKSDKLITTKLQHKYFYSWNEMYYISSKSRALNNQITEISRRTICRRIILSWVEFVRLRRQAEHQKYLAAEHQTKSLKLRYFSTLRMYSAHQKATKINSKTAEQLYKNNAIKHCLKIWSDKLEVREEEKIKFRTMMARKHFEFKVKQKHFSQLLDYAEYRNDRKDLYAIAEEQYQNNLLQHTISDWHIYKCYRKSVETKKQSADCFRTDLLYHKYFYIWIKMYKVKLDHDQDERLAVLHREKVLLSRTWAHWIELFAEKLEMNEKMRSAEDIQRCVVLRRVFKALRDYKRSQSSKVFNKGKSTEFLAHKQKFKVLVQWKKYTEQQKIKHSKTNHAASHHYTKLSKKALSVWLQYHGKIKRAKLSLKTVEDTHVKNMQQKCFIQWREEIKMRKTSVMLNKLADEHYSQNISSKFIKSWFSYTEHKAREHVNKMVILDEGKDVLNKLKLSQTFQLWKLSAYQSKTLRDKYEIAEQHHRNKVLLKTVRSLTVNSTISFKKRLLKQQLVLYKCRVVGRWFEKWKCAFKEKMRENERTADALWFWSLSLEQKVFQGWVRYTQYRRAKARQYTAALTDRRNHLLLTGIRQWISTITSQEQTSTDMALLRAAQQAEKSNRLALKWGRHWLAVTVKRRAAKKQNVKVHQLSELQNDVRSGIAYLNSVVSEPSRMKSDITFQHGSSFGEVPDFYSQFTALKNQRPPPKIPSFFVQSKYSKSEEKERDEKSHEMSVKRGDKGTESRSSTSRRTATCSGLPPPTAFT